MFKPIVFAISVLLGHPGQDVFLIDANQMTEVVDSKENRKELRMLTKAYQKAMDEYEFLRFSQAQNFVDVQHNREVQSSDLRSLLSKYRDEQMTYLSVLLDLRIQLQAVPDSAEWSEYIQKEYTQTKSLEQGQIASELMSVKRIADLKKTIEKSFSGSKYEGKAQRITRDFIHDLVEITENEADRQSSSEYILIKKNASRTELQKILEDQFLFYRSLGDAFIQFRTEILQIVEPKDWNDISLKLSKLVYD